jgi:hypothetical protein
MTNAKKLTAVAILSALVATPVFAHATHHIRAYDVRNFRWSYNQLGTSDFRDAYDQAPLDWPYYYTWAPVLRGPIGEDFQLDRSFPGGHDPDLNPPGN